MSSSATLDASAGRPSSPEDSFTSSAQPPRPGSLSRQRATQTMAFRQQFALALQTHFAADGRKFLLERLGFGEYLPAVEPEQSAVEGEEAAAAAAAAAVEGEAAAAMAAGMEQMRLEQQASVASAAAGQLLHGDGSDFFEQSPSGAVGGWVGRW